MQGKGSAAECLAFIIFCNRDKLSSVAYSIGSEWDDHLINRHFDQAYCLVNDQMNMGGGWQTFPSLGKR